MPRLRDLPEPHVCDLTETPQRFLASAHDSVETVLGTLDTIRQLRKQETGSIGGRLTSQEEDLLRAAIVFTGAGLDATLKRLVRDTLVHVIGKSEQAHKKLETFAAARLGTGEIADTKMIARYLVARDARSLLIDDYVYELSGSSLQSAEEVDNTAGALGIDDAELRKRINAQGLRSERGCT
jgi:hypothetical protein